MDSIQSDPRIPAHVPPELVFEYDVFSEPGRHLMPQVGIARKLHRQAPPIFYSPLNGGHWVVTRAQDVRDMFRQPDKFTTDPAFNYQKKDNPTRHLPNFYDPPEHTDARAIFAPMFSPAMARSMEAEVRTLAAALVDAVYDNGTCDFVHDIGHMLPVTIFLRLVKGPVEKREEMIGMAARYLRGQSQEVQHRGLADLADLLSGLLVERRASPSDDLLTRVINGKIMGEPITEAQQLGGAVFMFLAGLDTVAACMSFVMAFLARNPQHYAFIAADPMTNTALALEELIRVSGVATPERGVTHDLVYSGIQFRQGDRIVYLIQLSGVDDAEYANPYDVDFTREVSPHLVFGSGHHRCLGSHLARLEIRVLLEEWAKRIKHFGVAPGHDVKINGGVAWVPDALPLVWAP